MNYKLYKQHVYYMCNLLWHQIFSMLCFYIYYISMFPFLPSSNYKHFINVEWQFFFLKLLHLNTFPDTWGHILNQVLHHSDAGDERPALGTTLTVVVLRLCCTREPARTLRILTSRLHSTPAMSEIPEVGPGHQHYFILPN